MSTIKPFDYIDPNTEYDLDIRDFKQKEALELKKEIIQAVKDTQSVIIRALPNRIVMSKDQYDLLQHDPMLQKMYESDHLVYLTPLNAMEVVVQ